MMNIFKKLLDFKIMRILFLDISVFFHNRSYKAISIIATKNNGGEHPKYRILNYDRFFLENISSKDSVLDVGCGNGVISCKLACKAKLVMGLDIKLSNIQKAKKICKKSNAEFIVTDIWDYEPDFNVDVIILSNVLEHIHSRIKLLKKLANISSVMLLRVPMVTRDWVTVYKKQLGKEYRLSQDHKIEYTLEQLKKELEKGNWSIKEYQIKYGEFWGVLQRNSEK